MAFALLGINHKTADVAHRERFAFNVEALDAVLYSLTSHPLISGAVILSTCNRTEIYFSFEKEQDRTEIALIVKRWLYHYQHLDEVNNDKINHQPKTKAHPQLDPALNQTPFYILDEKATVRHLMEVACGIDSMILGEPQILGQVRQAYHLSQSHNCLSIELNKLFQTAFHVAKKIRTETEIGSHSASVAYSAYQLIQRTFLKEISFTEINFKEIEFKETKSNEISNKKPLSLMLIGAGEMNTLIARYLSGFSFEKVLIANRTQKNAQLIGDLLNAEVISLSAISERIKEVDIVVSCTASPLPIIGKGMLERSLAYRQKQGLSHEMLLIDLAVPHDIEREICDLPNVKLKTIDDLQQVVDFHIEIRQKSAVIAKNLIEQQVQIFLDRLHEARAAQLIQTYRNHEDHLKKRLLKKAQRQLKNGQDPTKVLDRFAHRLSQTLLHSSTIAIKQIARQEQTQTLSLLLQLHPFTRKIRKQK